MSARKDREIEEALRRVAFHESGHAVASLKQGTRVNGMWIDVSNSLFGGVKIGGMTYTDDDESQMDRRERLASAATNYAGPEAEALERHYRTGDRLTRCRRDAHNAAGGDLANSVRVLGGKGGDLRKAEGMGTSLVLRHWLSIERVALELIEHRELSWSQIRSAA